MGKLRNLSGLALLYLLTGCNNVNKTASKVKRPNIIVLYVDDMGIGDVSYLNGKIAPTPNIDSLAHNGKVFTQYYTTAPVCSPSRVALTTGMYHIRWNINTFLNDRKFNRNCEQSDFLKSSAPTIAKQMQGAGYKTAHFGKWHMGGGRDVDNAPSIKSYGFDTYKSTWESPDPDPVITASNWIWSPEDSIKRWERTAYFVDQTLEFLKANKNASCFINLWPDDVHSPWVASEQFQNEEPKRYFSKRNLQPVVAEFDRQVGRLLKGLAELGINENTLIIFTSDNGPAPSFEHIRTNDLRGIKNSIYEGGINMPFIAYWPGHIKGGQTDSTSIIASVDMFPTLCEIAGAELPDGFELDGEDIGDCLKSNKTRERNRDLFFEYGRNTTYNYPRDPNDKSPQLGIRHQNWKLLTDTLGNQVELYNLNEDRYESVNVSSENFELTEELKVKLLSWYKKFDKEYQ
ncbi:sulfatase-like hydrolase/transferase [Saccharicrinis sp. FJH62]|uniref:sulfatase-like hydrolase/transferase n=1 Tax=Saccharicrinis sp. FJH62 TaxID=3344657 RepID=UPI0035D47C8D